MTAEELKMLLSTPAALFFVMLFGSLASMLKQISDAKKNGTDASLGSYLAHWPETAGTIITNALGFLTLVVTDQLNFASALGIGYAANSAADLLRSGGRSASLNRQAGFARPLLLVLMLAMAIHAMLLLSGCATNGGLTDGGKAALREVAAIGVARYARESADPAKLERIRATLSDLQQLPDITTVDGLRELVQARIDAQVGDPYDRQDLTRLLNIVAPLLTDYVGSGQLAPDAVVKVREFLGYLADALPPA